VYCLAAADAAAVKGVPRIVHLGQDRWAEGRQRGGGGSLERGQQPYPPATGAPKGFPPFSTLRMASPDIIILLIVDYHAVTGRGGGKRPVSGHYATIYTYFTSDTCVHVCGLRRAKLYNMMQLIMKQ